MPAQLHLAHPRGAGGRSSSVSPLLTRVSHLAVVERGTQRPIGILSTADIRGVLGWSEA